MKKYLLIIIIFILPVFLFSQKKSGVNIGILNGPSCLPAAYLMEDSKNFIFQKFSDPQSLLPKLIKKEIDIAFLPLNVAAKVYNSGNKAILCCAVTGSGNLFLITNDKKIKSFHDLKGKTVYSAGQGASPEYMLCYLLKENKLTYTTEKADADVLINFSIPTAQLVPYLLSGKISYAVLPEPFITIAKLKSDKVYTPLNFQKEYREFSGEREDFPLTVMVARKEFVENNPEELKVFLNEYEKAVKWTIKNPAASGRLVEKYSLGLNAAVVEKAIPLSNYTFITAGKAITSAEALLKIFLENSPSSIGDKLPDRDFYYEVK